MAGSTSKSGASLLSKGSGGKSAAFGSGSKATLGSSSKSSNFGSSASKSSNFGSSIGKTSNFGSSASKTTNFGSSASKTSNFSPPLSKTSTFETSLGKSSTFGSSKPKDSASTRGPSFLVGGGKMPTGLTPSTSRKTYDTALYNPKQKSTSFGIIWLPGRKRNKKKEMAFSAMNYDKRNERTPTMYNAMSGDSHDYQLHGKKKDEEANLLMPDKVKGPIATAASAGAVTIASEGPSDLPSDSEETLLSHDKEGSKEAAGDGINKEKDTDYLENNDVVDKSPSMHNSDAVDPVFMNSPIKPQPQSQSVSSNPNDEDCGIKCLYYTLQCCDCSIM